MARLGWIGPGIFIGGVVIAAAGIGYFVYARPVPGDVIASEDCEGATMVVRDERGGVHDFVELDVGSDVAWQGMIPDYAGDAKRSGIACSHKSISVRIARSGRAEVWGFLRGDGEKLGEYRIATEREPQQTPPTGPITLTDHVRSYEFVGGPDWHQVVGVDIDSGKGKWKTDLGPEPIDDGGLAGDHLWIRQRGTERWFATSDGREIPVTKPVN